VSLRLRLVTAVAGVVALAVALSGCLYAQIPPVPPTDGASLAPQTDGVSAELLPYYGQTLDWQPCGTGLDCTTVTVPRDYSDTSVGELQLAVVRHRATSGKPIGSLLTNPGGPGAAGVSLMKQALSILVDDKLTQDYDVIGFDPRGVGESTAVTCYEPAQLDAFLYDVPPGARGSDERKAALDQRAADFAKACQDHSDGILPYITTENSARDIDVLRAVLGDPKLNYLGFSYGTFLGATYAGLFPERVNRMVLDGGIDPSVSGSDTSLSQAVGFEQSLRSFMADCLKTKECPFAGTVDDAMADVASLLARVDARPITAADGRRLGGDTLMTAITAALYSEESWPYLRSALTDVSNGRADVAFQLADFYNGRMGDHYDGNTMEAFIAYNCMDYPDQGTDAAVTELQKKLDTAAPVVAPYWSGSGGDPCKTWPAPPTGKREPITAPGSPPILVVGTTGDPATPYEGAQNLASQLSQGVLITNVGEGHLGYNKGNACVTDAVDAYLIDGTVPDDGHRCG
jgi:pimeloyl-ACP methyl ester carboxylesterase